MFTGIITEVGHVRSIARDGDTRFEIATAFDTSDIATGASIACSGPCLTVVDKGTGWFAVEASAETMARTTLSRWQEGKRINLERSLKLGDELGGHHEFGHVEYRKSTRLNSSYYCATRMPSSACKKKKTNRTCYL